MSELTKEYFDQKLGRLDQKVDQLEQNLKGHVQTEIFNLVEINAKSFDRLERKLEKREEDIEKLNRDVCIIKEAIRIH